VGVGGAPGAGESQYDRDRRGGDSRTRPRLTRDTPGSISDAKARLKYMDQMGIWADGHARLRRSRSKVAGLAIVGISAGPRHYA